MESLSALVLAIERAGLCVCVCVCLCVSVCVSVCGTRAIGWMLQLFVVFVNNNSLASVGPPRPSATTRYLVVTPEP